MKSFAWTWSTLALLFSSACSGSEAGASTSAAQQPPRLPPEPFAFPPRSVVGSGVPGELARGDLDGDGVTDVAVPLMSSTVAPRPSVVLSYLDRSGHTARTVELADAVQPRDVAIADCNGDGRADVLVADDHGEVEPGEVLVYVQRPNGKFGVPLRFTVGVEPIRLIAARWDGDTKLDVLTVHDAGQSVCVLPGRGNGTFEPARFTEYGEFGARFVEAGDLDQDGALDLALVHFYGGFLLLGSGDGRFGMPHPFTTDSNLTALHVADVTGDGFLDILRTGCDLTVLEGDGAGNFAPGFMLGFIDCPWIIESGDLDGDDIVDLVLVTSDGITPVLGLGSGDFARSATFSPGLASLDDLALWDADGDLDLDLLCVLSESDARTHITTDLGLIAGRGDGTFEGPGQFAVGTESRALLVGDFVHDGVPDLAVLDYPPSLAVLGGAGDGTFLPRIDTPLPVNWHVVASADLDGNTLDDLLAANTDFTSNQLALLSSTGTGTFDAPITFPSGGFSPQAVRVADLDSDLLPDLVVSTARSNRIAVHLGLPGGFAAPLSFGVGAFPRDIELDDLDGDGLLDAVVANQDGDSASVLIGNGDGTFLSAVDVPAFDGAQEVEIGDFDADGFDDLAVAGHGSGDSGIVLLSGMGDGTFTPLQRVPGVAQGVYLMTAADVNRDGLLDLVTATRFAVFVQIANGPASYEPPSAFVLERGLGGMELTDLDADGKTDLVVAAGSRALVFLNQAP